ncbi:MAG TPA: Ig domain-containing protein [Gemmatimonadales bacterium]|nr:Ig domain-containing protein [Gemmatimonadales bacterium]
MTATAALALVAAAPAFANEPFWTQAPSLSLQGNQLVGSNGGWQSYSGPVNKYVFRFLRDGVAVKGPADALPKSTAGGAPLPAGTYPDDSTANIYPLTSADFGHCFVLEVWGGIHSVYYRTDGSLAYDAWEWGHLDTFGNPAVTSQVCVGGTPQPPTPPAPPPPPPPPPPPTPQLAFVDTWVQVGTVGVAYTRQLSVQNGTAPSFSLASGTLPNGLTVSAAGLLSGIPTKAGQFAFTVRATDPVAKEASHEFSIQIVAPDLAIAPQILRGGRANVPYSQQLSVYGGYAPYSYSVTSGALPNGMTLSADGLLSGTPDAPAGEYAFAVQATDSYGLTALIQLVFTVLPPRVAFDTRTLPAGVRLHPYSTTLEVSGGSEPYTFAVVAGALPPGVVLGSDGTLRGRPTRAGNFGFAVQATDQNGVKLKHFYGLKIRQR